MFAIRLASIFLIQDMMDTLIVYVSSDTSTIDHLKILNPKFCKADSICLFVIGKPSFNFTSFDTIIIQPSLILQDFLAGQRLYPSILQYNMQLTEAVS